MHCTLRDQEIKWLDKDLREVTATAKHLGRQTVAGGGLAEATGHEARGNSRLMKGSVAMRVAVSIDMAFLKAEHVK